MPMLACIIHTRIHMHVRTHTHTHTHISIQTQALYYHSCSETLLKGLSKLQSQLPDTAVAPRTCDVMSEESIVKSTEKYLDDIRTLSIVGNTPVP